MSIDLTPQFTVPSQSSASEYFKADERVGTLLLITPTAYNKDIPNQFGKEGETKDQVVADVVLLDGVDAEHKYIDAHIYAGSLIKALKSVAIANQENGTNKLVLARLSKGAATRPGYRPPYVLVDPTEADITIAKEYLAKNLPAPF